MNRRDVNLPVGRARTLDVVLREVGLPERIDTEAELEELLTRPSPALVDFISQVPSPLLVLGAGGKMGPTLAVLAKRAATVAGHGLEVVAVSRFSNTASRRWLERQGVKTIAADLLNARSFADLPDASALIYLVGQKFGTTQDPAATWAVNVLVPVNVLERYRLARIAALSTGNVYPLTEVSAGGAVEGDPLTPLGEYANAAVARERIFTFCSRRHGTPIALLRLFYAVELRYGVLMDVAGKVHAGEPVDLANGYFNFIWQGDANEFVLRSLALAESPPSAWNLCRPQIFSVRAVAEELGKLLGRQPIFSGREAPTALLGNSAAICAKLGGPAVALETMLRWIAHWAKQGGRILGKPTHFEVRDGKY